MARGQDHGFAGRLATVMPHNGTASALWARAAVLASRAEGLAQRAPPALQDELMAIELQAANIRVLLASGLEPPGGLAPTLPRLDEQLRACAHHLDAIENLLQLARDAADPHGQPDG